ncbi:MAG: hypothetical protein AAGJ93_03165 [Bacteroidota bacterium]
MTVNKNDIRMNIINIIAKIDDADKLERIYEKLEKEEYESEEKPNIADAIVEITEGLTYEEILEDQDYKQLTDDEFEELTSQIEWDYSLEELLAELD